VKQSGNPPDDINKENRCNPGCSNYIAGMKALPLTSFQKSLAALITSLVSRNYNLEYITGTFNLRIFSFEHII